MSLADYFGIAEATRNTRNFLLQEDLIEYFSSYPDGDKWIILSHYDDYEDPVENFGIFCALLPKSQIDSALTYSSWDLSADGPRPGFSGSSSAQGQGLEYKYFNHHSPEEVEPILIFRNFHGLRPSSIEVSEEFRLFHNLYWESSKNSYVKFDDDGEEDVVIQVIGKSYKCRKKYLLQFAAAKSKIFSWYFSVNRYVDDYNNDSQEWMDNSKADRTIELCIRPSGCIPHKPAYLSTLCGKIIIDPGDVSKSGIWPYEIKHEDFPDFVIGQDNQENLIRSTCNYSALTNYFKEVPGAAHVFTPVFFKKEVLKKYYDHSEKYSVSDGRISCGTLWSFQIDNDMDAYVSVFLGDIGKYMPNSERQHWLIYNIPPEGSISLTCFKRSFMGEPHNADSPDLKFRYLYVKFIEGWLNKHGWSFFNALHQDDSYHLDTIRIPLIENQTEFDAQIGSLTKLLIDSLNEKKFKDFIVLEKDDKGIRKLEKYLLAYSFMEVDKTIKYFRNLQDLRSKMHAHNKGDSYEKIIKSLKGNQTIKLFMSQMLEEACDCLNAIGNHFGIFDK